MVIRDFDPPASLGLLDGEVGATTAAGLAWQDMTCGVESSPLGAARLTVTFGVHAQGDAGDCVLPTVTGSVSIPVALHRI